MKRLVALVPNVLGVAPGQRARIELWAEHLQQAGWTVELHPFEDDRLHDVLYAPGHMAAKARRMLGCYLRHLAGVVRGFDADVLLVYREAALVGPAISERLAARRTPRMVFDLDDPTFLPYRSPVNGWFSLLKVPGKTRSLFRLSDHVITINEPIAAYARQYNPSVSIVPNLIDTDRYHPGAPAGDGRVRIAWIGSHTTRMNLETIAGPLRRLHQTVPAPLRVIADEPVPIDGVETEYRPWSSANEVHDLAECDIGVVPVNDLPWNSWKFYFKTLQYMAVGLPVVARPLGSNPDVIRDGVNGFLVRNEDEWHDRLLTLVGDEALRRRMGEAARATVVESYSLRGRMPKVIATFDAMVAPAALHPNGSRPAARG
ncbi:MAG TPA: glycosyltransferase family 4 protein [Acidimicrobiales bacterium]|nr:glycosyltransferase family 4 protein [Acidimicrobiales bacterium]